MKREGGTSGAGKAMGRDFLSWMERQGAGLPVLERRENFGVGAQRGLRLPVLGSPGGGTFGSGQREGGMTCSGGGELPVRDAPLGGTSGSTHPTEGTSGSLLSDGDLPVGWNRTGPDFRFRPANAQDFRFGTPLRVRAERATHGGISGAERSKRAHFRSARRRTSFRSAGRDFRPRPPPLAARVLGGRVDV